MDCSDDRTALFIMASSLSMAADAINRDLKAMEAFC